VEVFVARHAIFDRNLSLFGYELLFRSCRQNSCDISDDDATTLQVLANSLLSAGLQSVSFNAPLFINFGRGLLTSHWSSVFPPEAVVIEILETVTPDPEVLACCLELGKRGYQLALDDVVGSQRDDELMGVASFVKVDFRATTREQQADIAARLKGSGKRLVAEKVETHQEFDWACAAGYDLFQGFFFARPTLMRGRQLPNSKISALRMLRELHHPDLDFTRLETLIKCDVSLTYKLFRYVNSALFGRQKQTCSVKEALVVLGELDVRRWMTLATLPGLASGRANELIVLALVRARFCELLGEAALIPDASDLFLMGMFSLLDALLDVPLGDVLSELALPERITGPLLNGDDCSVEGYLYRAALAYETADWKTLEAELIRLPISGGIMAAEYLTAVSWAAEMLGGVTAEPASKGDLQMSKVS
jgi:c-di-GMP-related signal transduction protein